MTTLVRLRFIFLLFFFLPAFLPRARADWTAEWEKTVKAAKQEAMAVVYTFPGHERLFQEFQKKFREIRLVEVTVRGSERVTGILSERRAEKYIADLLILLQGLTFWLR